VAKVSRPVLYGGILGVGVIVWLATTPQGPAEGVGGKLDRSSSRSRQVQTQFTEEDLKARFDRLNEQPRNAFRPLVARTDKGGKLAPNEFPASYTGGEAGWFYTGTVVVNDVPSALVENEVSGEGLYLTVGESLKSAVIAQITPTYIVVRATSGQTLRLDLLRDVPEEGEGIEDLGLEPVRPDVPGGLRGPIRADSLED
jgi:hypothetical protein